MQEKEREEPRKEPAKDYYAGYVFGSHPYTSNELPGRKGDEELKNDIIVNIRKNLGFRGSNINVSVFDATVTLSGVVKTYDDRSLAGQTTWNTPGVVKVLNELDVTEPDTAGPKRRV
ncbi:MAG TPA: BON domain-containing protein [Nitrososphaeraceae archaeon]|jgi:osmotically-inducible protein OsmY